MGRGQDEAAVPADDRRDAVARERGQVGLPPHDTVEMGMALDEARRDMTSFRIENSFPGPGLEGGRDLGDDAAADQHVGGRGDHLRLLEGDSRSSRKLGMTGTTRNEPMLTTLSTMVDSSGAGRVSWGSPCPIASSPRTMPM